MSRMFENTYFNRAISDWNVSRVTDMSAMFLNAQSFDDDISSWNVSRVTDMSRMFENTYFNRAISDWNVSRVTDMSGMFRMNGAFDQPLNWDVSQVTDMSAMFLDAQSFNGDISSWDVSQVANMSRMFENTNFNQAISDWNVSQVTDMSDMFSGAFEFNQNITSWDVSRVTDMSGMFEGTPFNQAISNWSVSQVTDMSDMFSNAFNFNQNITSWDVSRVTDMSHMFENTPFNQDISDWNVSQVTDMSDMFSGAFEFNQDISNWSVSQVTDMSDMFGGVFFDQNLGNWYITLDSTVIDADDAPGAVANITAQNQFLSDMSVTYDIRQGGDSDSFNITDNKLYLTVTPDKTSYSVTIKSFASGEFGTDNHRAYAISVSGISNQGAPAGIRPDRAVYNPPSGGLPATLTLSFDGPTNGTIRTGHLSVRDALSGNSIITLAGAPAAVHDLSQIYGGPPTPLIYEVRLGPEAAALVEGAAEPVLDMDPGAVYGPAGSPSEPLLGYPIAVPDVTPPAVRSVTFDPAAFRLEITFTEAIDHDLTDRTGMTMRGSLANLTLPDAGGRPSPADALAVPLNRTHLDTLGGAPTHLDIAAGAVSDAAGNPIITAAIQVTTPDTVPPEVSSVTLEQGTGLLEVAFTEVIDHAATKYDAMTILGTSSNITLARVDGLSATNGTISVALSQANLQAVGTPRSLSILAGSVVDTAGNPIAAATLHHHQPGHDPAACILGLLPAGWRPAGGGLH